MIDIRLLCYLLSAGFVASFHVAYKLMAQVVNVDNLVDAVFGPYGVLALLLLAVYFLAKFIIWLLKRNDDLNKQVIEEYRKRIEKMENDKS